jgi:hypothetical protein
MMTAVLPDPAKAYPKSGCSFTAETRRRRENAERHKQNKSGGEGGIHLFPGWGAERAEIAEEDSNRFPSGGQGIK